MKLQLKRGVTWTGQMTRRIVTGYVTKVNGQVISSKGVKQYIVTASSCHAEVVAANTAARDAMWTIELFKECCLTPKEAKLIIDNHGAERTGPSGQPQEIKAYRSSSPEGARLH